MNDYLQRFKELNWFFIILIMFLTFIGVVMIYSATYQTNLSILISHLSKILIGFLVMILIASIDINFWKKYAFILFFLSLMLLMFASFYGYIGKGSRRWISLSGFNFQPSELMKILILVILAKYFEEKKINELRDYLFLIFPISIVVLTAGLIISQPDLGTAMIIILISLIVFFLAGISWKFFALLGFSSLIITPYLWSFLKNYQKERILTLFNPDSDPLGSGYHIIQSQIAVGSGGVFGKGWLKGTQSHLDFLPEKHTDFIFSMLGEEFGFLGTISVIGLIIIITSVGFRISNSNNQTDFNRLLGLGIISNFFFAAFINMSMVIGLLPVVGLPFPLVSYGGSSMLSYFIGFGIILSIQRCSQYRL